MSDAGAANRSGRPPGTTAAGASGGGGGGAAKGETILLNTAKADRQLWLLKIPNFVAQQWFGVTAPPTAPGLSRGMLPLGRGLGAPYTAQKDGKSKFKTGDVIGKVRMAFDPVKGTSEFSVILAPLGDDAGTPSNTSIAEGAEMEFPLDYMQNHIPMQVFSDNPRQQPGTNPPAAKPAIGGPSGAGPGLLLEGRVEFKFDMRPPLSGGGPLGSMGLGGGTLGSGGLGTSDMYSRMVKERSRLSNTPVLSTKPKDETMGEPLMLRSDALKRKVSPFPGARQLGAAASSQRAEGGKRVRMEKKDLERALFRLFEEQPSWTLRQLTESTNQPQQFLKEVLNELCEYHKSGKLQGQYELKPEFKTGDSAAAAQGEASGDPPGMEGEGEGF